jgi:hypothetical protein
MDTRIDEDKSARIPTVGKDSTNRRKRIELGSGRILALRKARDPIGIGDEQIETDFASQK